MATFTAMAFAADSGGRDRPLLLDIGGALLVAGTLAVCGFLGIYWIHTLRKQVQQQSEQILAQLELQARRESGVLNAARLESLGVLAGGIAHDYNNLLTVVMGHLAMLKQSPRIMEGEAHRLEEIERGIQRARELARQLLTFATGGEPVRAPLDVEETVRAALDVALRRAPLRAEYAIEPGLWAGAGDRDQLIQGLQHVVDNALQAMPEGGVLRVGLANESVEAGAGDEKKAGRYVRISLTDSGPGIAPEILPKIFDPYFTTRRGARGLGLAAVHSIMSRHGGWVEVASIQGQGTTVTLRLPATMQAVVAERPVMDATVAPAAISAAKPRVLLMDDEAGVREIAAFVLQRMGLEVTAVDDGRGALQEFENARSAGRPFTLLIVDLTVRGGMGGKETLDAIRKLDPSVPAIVISGYSSDPVMTKYHSYGFQAVVPKPFDIATLTAAVRRFIPQAVKPV